MIKRLGVRHGQPQNGILSVEATDLVRIGDRPGIDFASCSSRAFHHRLGREPLIDQKPVECLPFLHQCDVRVSGPGSRHDVKTIL